MKTNYLQTKRINQLKFNRRFPSAWLNLKWCRMANYEQERRVIRQLRVDECKAKVQSARDQI